MLRDMVLFAQGDPLRLLDLVDEEKTTMQNISRLVRGVDALKSALEREREESPPC